MYMVSLNHTSLLFTWEDDLVFIEKGNSEIVNNPNNTDLVEYNTNITPI